MTLSEGTWWLLLANVAAWAFAHAATGYAAHRLPEAWCTRDGYLTRLRSPGRTERRCRLFRVSRWKDSMPEAGAFFAGGVSKKHLPGTSTAALVDFAALTRRAELGHWMALFCAPLFALWNPLHVVVLMVTYGVLVNAPFIAIQRYNRLRVARILTHRAGRHAPAVRRRTRSDGARPDQRGPDRNFDTRNAMAPITSTTNNTPTSMPA